MEEQRIQYETAILAEEKGFNIDTIPVVYKKETKNILYLTGGYDSREDAQDYTSAPTQSLLETWLFEKHNIHIEITFDDGTWLGYIGEFSFPDSSVELKVVMETEGFKDAKREKREFIERVLQSALSNLK